MGKYFGTDGIRGEVGKFLTVDLCVKIGKALSLINRKTVIIGYDTRESNLMLRNALALGANDVGKKVIDVGVISTPGLCLTAKLRDAIGVMITASHNPFHDNGVKIFIEGVKIEDEVELQIEKYLDSHDNSTKCTDPLIVKEENVGSYIEYLQTLAKPSGMRIGIDCAHGATYKLAREIFTHFVSEVHITADEPNGRNINHDVGATHPQNIASYVVDNSLDIGFCFDGDGDRLIVADEKGKIYSGDQILYVFANYFQKHGMLKDNSVVLTKMSNIGIINSLRRNGINSILTDVGDRNVFIEMKDKGLSLGGENSGHFIIRQFLETGDGMLSAIILLNILGEENDSLAELTDKAIVYPEKIIGIPVLDKNIAKEDRIVLRVSEINKQLGEHGKLIVRASGTEELIRVSCCAKDEYDVDKYINELSNMIRR